MRQTLDRASEARSGFEFEHRLLMPNGSVKHIRVSACVVAASSGNLEFVGAVTDITAAKQAEHELRRITDAIPQLDRRLESGMAGPFAGKSSGARSIHGLSIEEMQAEKSPRSHLSS